MLVPNFPDLNNLVECNIVAACTSQFALQRVLGNTGIYKLGSTDKPILQFDGGIDFAAQALGTTADDYWLWAWANPSLAGKLISQGASEIRTTLKDYSWATTEEIPLSDHLSLCLAIMSWLHLESDAFWKMSTGNGGDLYCALWAVDENISRQLHPNAADLRHGIYDAATLPITDMLSSVYSAIEAYDIPHSAQDDFNLNIDGHLFSFHQDSGAIISTT